VLLLLMISSGRHQPTPTPPAAIGCARTVKRPPRPRRA